MMNPIVRRLERDVAALCAGRDRRVGSADHARARSYLADRFREIGLQPYSGAGFELGYEVRRTEFTNVVGVVAGRDADARPVLIGAHYDTVAGTPGADDNAAAIAIALEVARRLAAAPAPRPVVIAHFDAEEPPFFHSTAMGSTRFVSDQVHGPVHAALVLDLVGHAIGVPGLEDAIAIMGSESHGVLARAVDEHATSFLPVLTLANRFIPDMSDHYAFRTAGAPYLFLTCAQWRHYHAPTDTPDVLDYAKMARVADLLEALVRDVAAAAMDGAVEHDTTAGDTERLQRVLGPRAAALALNGPRDFDRVVWRVVSAIQAG
jgi:hypothetical protein